MDPCLRHAGTMEQAGTREKSELEIQGSGLNFGLSSTLILTGWVKIEYYLRLLIMDLIQIRQ